jgi:hypothetical protein
VAAPTAAPTAVTGAATSQPSGAPTPSGLPPGIGVANTPTERAVVAAYEKYLQVYAEAALNLDTSRLSEVLDGQALQWVTDEINDRRARGRPLKVIEEDRLVGLSDVTETTGILFEEYTSRSAIVDVNTKQPLPRSSPVVGILARLQDDLKDPPGSCVLSCTHPSSRWHCISSGR